MNERRVPIADGSMRDDLYARCRNWGRFVWRELMRDAPDSSCTNSIYDMGRADAHGHGELTEDTVVVAQLVEVYGELPPIDDSDAEVMHTWIRQTPRGCQETLYRRFVYLDTRGQRGAVDNALRGISRCIDANLATVRQVELAGTP